MRVVETALTAAALSLMLAGAARADSWHVIEGPGGKSVGVWNVTIDNGVITGNGVMSSAEKKPITYSLNGKVDGTAWTIDRVNPSDGILCTYQGKSPLVGGLRKPTEISGTAMCQAKTGLWKVRVMSAK